MENEALCAKDAFQRLFDIVKRLRSPSGCPWDRAQTPESLRGALLEETGECVEAISAGESAHIREELGDVFLVAMMISYMNEEAGNFSLASVLSGISEKLIRRHPHVFGDLKVSGSTEVLQNWAKIKVEKEGRTPKDSLLDDVSRALPPLERSYKLQKKAAKAGFDWEEARDVFLKIEEEAGEVKEALENEQGAGHLEEELGDLLFASVNLCRFLGIDPSVALQGANSKFYKRFTYIEKAMKEKNAALSKENIGMMEALWQEAKA